MKKSGLVLVCFVLVLLTGCSGFQMSWNPTSGNAVQKQAAPSVNAPKVVYSCPFTAEPIKVDGFLDEPAWERAQVVNFMVPKTHDEWLLNKPAAHPIPISKTEARVLYDNKYLYVGFKAYDKDVCSYLKDRDSSTCNEDVLETFIKPDPVAHPDGPDPYYNFEINALGTVLDAYNIKRGAAGNYTQWSNWNCKGLKTGIQIKGTLNNYQDVDEYWTLEVAIPFAELPTLNGKAPQKGDVWLFNLCRYDYSVYLPDGVELSSYAPLSWMNFHLYEDWAKLKFE